MTVGFEMSEYVYFVLDNSLEFIENKRAIIDRKDKSLRLTNRFSEQNNLTNEKLQALVAWKDPKLKKCLWILPLTFLDKRISFFIY